MTKAEFGEQFKRLRVAGYRLPVFYGITIADVITEWYDTFKHCTVQEFSEAIDRLKQHKTDTFWPATGEIWAHVFEIRKGRKIRLESRQSEGAWRMSDEDSHAFLAMLREAKDKILGKMAMPKAEPQVKPDHVDKETA